MLTKIYVDNFKALVDFELKLSKTVFLIGLNGAGKSTILQFIDFVSSVAEGNTEEWLRARDWSASDLNSKLKKKSNIDFELEFDLGTGDNWGRGSWRASFNRSLMRCTHEEVKVGGETVARVSDGVFVNLQKTERSARIRTDYKGSYIFQLKDVELEDWPEISAMKEFWRKIQVLDSLSAQSLRKKSRGASGRLGLGGEKLSALIHEMSQESLDKLHDVASRFYPGSKFKTRSMRSGWKELLLVEEYGMKGLTTFQQHINDGVLRVLAIIALLQSNSELIVFDEIENGINPELTEELVNVVLESRRQVITTTHSPLILNFLPDDVALKSVNYLYRSFDGAIKSIPFFDIPSMRKKLSSMGPGEVFADTNLKALAAEIEQRSGASFV